MRACLAVLLAAIALYGAVRLVSAVWIELLIGVVALSTVFAAVWLMLRRRQRW